MKNLPLLLGTIICTLVLVIGVALFSSNQNQAAVTTEPADPQLVLGAARLATGSATPAITIVEFSDLQCPACRAIQPLVKQAAQQYPDKVKLVYRHFPLLTIHPYAQLAAQASEVAADQNQFWPYHDLLFARQSEWAELDSIAAVTEKFVAYAQELGLDTNSFSEKMNSSAIIDRINQDSKDAASLKLNSTPSIFVNNVLTPAPQLMTTIESILNSQTSN